MSAPLVFLDTETTGLHADRRPWEIAMIRREGDGSERRELIQVTDVDLSTAELIGLNIGGFYERHWGYADIRVGVDIKGECECIPLPERQAAIRVEAFTRGAHIVGAVPNFDTECLAAMLRRHGMIPAWHYHLIDVEALAVGYLARSAHAEEVFLYNTSSEVRESRGSSFVDRYRTIATAPWKSDVLSRMTDVPPPSKAERHTAMGDAEWVKRWYDRLMSPRNLTDGEAE